MIHFRKYRVLKPENSSPSRDSNPNSSTGGRRFALKADVLTITSGVAPNVLRSVSSKTAMEGNCRGYSDEYLSVGTDSWYGCHASTLTSHQSAPC